MQAWYSSSWSHATVSAFHSALSSLLQQQQQDDAGVLLPASVSALLQHWQMSDVTLSAARSAWLADRNHSCSYIANFKRKCDRLALAKYQVNAGPLVSNAIKSAIVGHSRLHSQHRGGL